MGRAICVRRLAQFRNSSVYAGAELHPLFDLPAIPSIANLEMSEYWCTEAGAFAALFRRAHVLEFCILHSAICTKVFVDRACVIDTCAQPLKAWKLVSQPTNQINTGAGLTYPDKVSKICCKLSQQSVWRQGHGAKSGTSIAAKRVIYSSIHPVVVVPVSPSSASRDPLRKYQFLMSFALSWMSYCTPNQALTVNARNLGVHK
jgi:hypothetical protein